MTVVSVGEAPDSPTGTISEDTHSFDRIFKVETNSYDDGLFVVTNAVPPLFSTYSFGNEFHTYARVRSIDAERIEPNSLWWIVKVHYETKPHDEDQDEQDDPLKELPEIRLSFDTQEEICTGTIEGSDKLTFTEGFVNSAGEVFEEQPARQRSNMVLTISRNENELAAHPQTALDYVDTVSSGAFFGQAAGTPKMVGIDVDRQVKQLKDGNIKPYLKVTYTIHFREEGWKIKILDSGSYYIDGDGNKVAFKTETGDNFQGLLDGAGGDNTGNPAVFLGPYQIFVEKSWAALGLPNSFLEGK